MRKRWNMKERLTAVALSAFLVLNSFSGSNLLVFGAERDNVSDTADVVSSNEVTEDEIISENETGNVDAAENNEDVEDAAGSVTGNEADKPVVEGSSEDAAGNETETIDGFTIDYSGTVLVSATGTGTSLDLSKSQIAYTQIGDQAFKNAKSIESITLPDSLISIGYDAFQGCSLSGELNIPNNVTTIHAGAFENCTDITSVKLPDKLKTFSDYVYGHNGTFKGCTSLAKVSNVGNMTDINLNPGSSDAKYMPFNGCTSLTTVEFKSGITKIAQCLFAYCGGLRTITIPASVTEIGDYAFRGSGNLETVNFEGSSGLTKIGVGAFRGATSLSTFGWGNTTKLTTIEKDAFLECTSLKGSLTIPDSVTTIHAGAFENCTGITSVRLPDKLKTFSDYLYGYNGTFKGCTSLAKVSNVGNMTDIGINPGESDAKCMPFNGCTSLTTVEFKSGITKIAQCLFAYCGGLRTITIPASVTEIGDYAFRGSGNLETVNFEGSSGLTKIGVGAFRGATSLSTFGWGNATKLTTIEKDVFLDCTSLNGDLSIPDSVTTIHAGAFENCTGITTVRLPDKLTTFSDYLYGYNGTFKGCTSLTKVSNVGNMTDINLNPGESDAKCMPFNGCTSLTTIEFKSGITKIAQCLFAYCDGLRTITIPASVTEIGNYAFRGSESLDTVNFGAGSMLRIIGTGAFRGATSLSTFGWGNTITTKLTTIGNDVFLDCTSLNGSLSIPDSVTAIHAGAFENCTGITAVRLPDNLKTFSDHLYGYNGTFKGCTSLKTVTNIGDMDDISSGGSAKYMPFNDCSALDTISFRSGIKKIAQNLFSSNTGLSSVSIPESVTEIGGGAFENCSTLREISLPTTLETVRKSAFKGATSLDTVNYAGSADSWDFITIEDNNDPLTNAARTYQNKPCIRTVYYVYNGGTDKQGRSDFSAAFEVGEKPTFPEVTNDGFTLEGWYEDSAFKTKWDPQKLISKTITLYAKWKANEGVKTYTIKFDKNGGEGTMSDLVAARDIAKKLRKNTFTRSNYEFKGWSKTADGAVQYTDEQSVTNIAEAGGSVTLYAVWAEKGDEPVPQTGSYTVKFDANGGTGTMPDQVIALGKKTALSANTFTRSGYEFSGWALSATGPVAYADGAEVPDLAKDGETVTLYAIWVLPSKGETYYRVNVTSGAEALRDGKTVYSAKKGQIITIRYTSTSKSKVFTEWVLTNATPKDKTAKETTFVMGTSDVIVDYNTDVDPESKKETPPPADSTPVKKLAFGKKTLKLKPDEEISNPATPTYGDSSERPEVKYVTSNSKIICVDPTGTFIAMGRGSATVTAYCGNKTATCKVTVMNYTQSIAIMTGTGEDITGGKYEINAGTQEMLYVTFDPCDTGDPLAVTWKSSNTKAVSVAKGLITAKEVKQETASTITATVKYTDPSTGKTTNMSRTATVSVKPISVPVNTTGDNTYSLSLKKSTAKLQRNISGKDSFTLGVTLSPKRGNSVADKIVEFESSNTSIVDVSTATCEPEIDSRGKGSANVDLIPEGNGTAYIIVKSYEAGGEGSSKVNIKRCKVTVTSPATGIEITSDTSSLLEGTGDSKTIEMRLGTYDTLTAEVTPEDSTDAGKITWSASGGVTVKNGMIFAKSLTKAGRTAKVTAKCGNKKTTVLVTVVK